MDFEKDSIEDYLRKIPRRDMKKPIILGVAALIVIIFLSSTFFSVSAESVGVVQRFGKYDRTTQPGLHFKLPAGIESVTKVPVTRIMSQEFGFRTAAPGIRTTRSQQALLQESLMLTGDLNVVVADWIVQYKVRDPREFLFKVRNVVETIRDVSEAAMRQVVGDRSVDGVLTVERMQIGEEAALKMQEILDKYETGIQIVTVKLQDVNPPDQVKPAFNAVNEAKQEKEQMINEAMKDYNTIIPKAAGDAERMITEAEGYAIDRVNRADGDAARFVDLWKQYAKAKDVTRRRLYMETMSDVLPKVKKKYIVDENEQGILRLLPLGESAISSKGGAK
ncbi:MAG: FtsH protease activity modulator HflK [candidate division Zixibacteria bacterium]|nr:FtsH protease activity modulator HflK [candidate division Zixibacteria bacterium]